MPDDIPDVYADQFQMNQSAYGLTLVFGAVPSTAGGPGPIIMDKRAVVRMSLEHAKILAMVLRKNLKQYELEHLGESIPLPRNILQQMGLSQDDW